MKTTQLLILSTVIGLACACRNAEHAPSPAPTAGSASTIPDQVVVRAKHRPSKPTDPVIVRIQRFNVVKATFDPAKLEGATATIDLDLTSLKSGDVERDDDLKSPAYIDVAKFATARIEIANVKPKQGATCSADASVTLRGVTNTYPVTFDVIAQQADSIQIKGEHTFSRLDFSVGADPATDPSSQVDTELTIQMVITLRR